MLDTLLAKVFGTQNQRDLKSVQPLVAEINARETDIQQLKRAKEELKKLSNTLSLNPLSTLTSDS